jgi:hypothetical protein
MDAILLTSFLEIIGWLMMAAFWLLVLWVFVFVFGDIFRRHDLSGVAKAGWILLVFIVPLIGALIYLAVRPKMQVYDPDIAWAPAAGVLSPADEVAYAQKLLAAGTITQAEFDEVKRNLGL